MGMFAGQLLAAASLLAQGPGDSATVRLSVRHAGAPLPGATVRVAAPLPDTAALLPAVSGAPGVLVLRLPAPGEYQLTVTAIGYAAACIMGVTLFRDIRYSDRPPEDR